MSATSGMVCDIKTLDNLVREHLFSVPYAGQKAAAYLVDLSGVLLANASVDLQQLELALTPQICFRYMKGSEMVTLVHQFEFAAAHRLHNEGLSAEENREMFGKCNFPNGHGHNYVLEISVTGPVSDNGEVCPLAELQETVKRSVIDRFDHKHLNKDCAEFAQVNPTVENIAQVCWNLLVDQVKPN